MSLKLSAKALKADPGILSGSAFDAQFSGPVCGIDEVGRGPLAGPVVAACAMIRIECLNDPFWEAITDSKKITAKKREALYDGIRERCYFGIAEVTPDEIDRLNIHHATLSAMKAAYGVMAQTTEIAPVTALIDGRFVPPALPCPGQAVIKGDSLSLAIGAASIIAKVYRDRLMAALHDAHPHYGWATNAGYGTAVHLAAIAKHGITPHHRRSFAPCAKRVQAA